MAEATAPCPICHKLVPLHAINNHIDICLLPGGRELHTELSESGIKGSQASTYHTTGTQPDLSTEPPRKKRSQSPSPRSSKQSFLSFGESECHQASTPPVAKSRRLNLTMRLQPAKPNTDGHKETLATAGPIKFDKTSSGGELSVPLAEAMRPSCIEDYVGQENAIGKNAILRTILESGNVPSLIFWGPPGCGKVHSIICNSFLQSNLKTCCFTSR